MKYESFKDNFLEMLEGLSNDFEAPPILSSEIIQNIQAGKPVEDIEFDQIYPPRIRALSKVQWSSIEVARRIAFLVGTNSTARFIDIGSGVGKLCVLLSLLTDMEIYGIEQREDLFSVSRTVVKNNHLKNIYLIHGNMMKLDWSKYDVFYFYNPFQEHNCGSWEGGLIDKNIDLDRKHYAQYISEAFRQMTWLKPGKKVITFHGYGGLIPPSMKLLNSCQVNNGDLCLWEKL